MNRIIILAAGKGKRMGPSDRPKVLHTILGKPMLAYVLDAVVESGVDARPVIVVGTGDAVMRARPLLEGTAEHVIVLVGDQPFVTAGTIRRVADTHMAAGAALTLGTVKVPDFEDWRRPFADFGRIVRDADGAVSRIVEVKDASPDQLAIKEINPSYYCFKAEWLWKGLESLTSENASGEYYLTDLLGKAIADGEKVRTVEIPPEEALGVNTLEQLAIAEGLMKERAR